MIDEIARRRIADFATDNGRALIVCDIAVEARPGPRLDLSV